MAQRFVEMFGADFDAFDAGERWDRVDAAARERGRAFVARIVKDRERTRMLLGLVIEADGDPALRDAVERGAGFVRSILARVMGRDPEDPDVNLALATLWGLGLQHLVFQRSDEETDALVLRALQRFVQTKPPSDARPAATADDEGA